MLNKVWILGLIALMATASGIGVTPVKLSYPNTWPDPVYDFSKNPLTQEGIALGRKLFYDPILSRDSVVSCASCHLSFTAFTHVDHKLSHGIADRVGFRNSLALMNLAWSESFMWDGAVNHLDMQALAPISDSTEMDEDFANVVRKVGRQPAYQSLFKAAFGKDEVTGELLLKAMAQFQLTFVSANSRFDKYLQKAPGGILSAQELNGYALFQTHCSSCHTEPLFASHQFQNNGLPLDSFLLDMGRMRVTGNKKDQQKFKVPSLRNLTFSQPYMHDGRFSTLYEVLNHYTTGIVKSKTLAPQLKKGIELSESEKIDVIAFLLTLSDKDFVFNSNLSYPQN